MLSALLEQRTVVTDEQKIALRYVFSHNQYPSARLMDRLGACINLTPRTVTNWFYNQRCRQKSAHEDVHVLPEYLAEFFPDLPTVMHCEEAADLDWQQNIMNALSAFASQEGESLRLDTPDDEEKVSHSVAADTVDHGKKKAKSLDSILAKIQKRAAGCQ